MDAAIAPGGAPARLSEKHNSLALAAIALLILFGSVVRIADLRLHQKLYLDEEIYAGQARIILERGFLQGSRATARYYLETPGMARYPPPTRIGFILPLAVAMKWTGLRSERPGAYL